MLQLGERHQNGYQNKRVPKYLVFRNRKTYRKVADVWKKDVWEFQAKSGSSGSCRLFLHFLGRIAVRKMSGRTPGSPRHPSSRHPRTSGTCRFDTPSVLIPLWALLTCKPGHRCLPGLTSVERRSPALSQHPRVCVTSSTGWRRAKCRTFV